MVVKFGAEFNNENGSIMEEIEDFLKSTKFPA